MYTIAIAIQKGGTGKTTTAINLSGALTLLGKRTLLIDLDPQSNCTTALGINPAQLDTPTITDVLVQDQKLEDAIVQTDYSLDLVPASIKLAVGERQLNTATSPKKLYRKLQDLKRQAQHNPDLAYDYVLIDCPPSLGSLTLNALAASDGVLSPINSEFFAEQGLSDFLQTMDDVRIEVNEKLDLVGILLTQYSGIKTHKDVANYLRQTFGNKVFKTIIAKRAILTEVPRRGPIQTYAPSSESAAEYQNLAQEVEDYVQRNG
jgi:chromosome partitioning protein